MSSRRPSPPAYVPVAPQPRRYAGVSAEERQKQRRERLIEAAFDVFGREGYRQSTMRLICAQARLTERYFYESFATLDDVYLAVHRRQSAACRQRIVEALMKAPIDDGVAQTRAGLTAFFEFIREDPRRAQILLIDAVTAGLTNPRNLNAAVSQYAELLRERLRKRYPKAVEQHHLDVDYVVAGFVGLIIHSASLWVERGFQTPIEVLVEHNVYAWRGLREWLDGPPQVTLPASPAP